MYVQHLTQLRIHYFKKYWFHSVIKLDLVTLLRAHLIKYSLETPEHLVAVNQLVQENQLLGQMI